MYKVVATQKKRNRKEENQRSDAEGGEIAPFCGDQAGAIDGQVSEKQGTEQPAQADGSVESASEDALVALRLWMRGVQLIGAEGEDIWLDYCHPCRSPLR